MRTVDIHAHWYPEEWLALFAKDGAAEGAALERSGERFMLRAKHITNAFDERFVVVDERVKAMDARGIDVHALSLTTPMVYWASAPLGLALSQAFNDAASAAHRKHPQRLVGLAMVPMQAPDLALGDLPASGRHDRPGAHEEVLPEEPVRQSVRHRRRRGAPHLRRRHGSLPEAGSEPAARGRHVSLAHRPLGSRRQGTAGAQTPEAAAELVPPPLHLRHHRARRAHQHEPRAPGRRRPRDTWLGLLLRHGPRRPTRDRQPHRG